MITPRMYFLSLSLPPITIPLSDHLSRCPYDALKTCNHLGPSPCQRLFYLISTTIISRAPSLCHHNHHIGDGGNSWSLDHNLSVLVTMSALAILLTFLSLSRSPRDHGHDPRSFSLSLSRSRSRSRRRFLCVSCSWWKHHLLRPPHVTFPANRVIRKWMNYRNARY
jgi:hypothetical protein